MDPVALIGIIIGALLALFCFVKAVVSFGGGEAGAGILWLLGVPIGLVLGYLAFVTTAIVVVGIVLLVFIVAALSY